MIGTILLLNFFYRYLSILYNKLIILTIKPFKKKVFNNKKTIFFISDNSNWVLDQIQNELSILFNKLNYTCISTDKLKITNSTIFFLSKYSLKKFNYFPQNNKYILTFFHFLNDEELIEYINLINSKIINYSIWVPNKNLKLNLIKFGIKINKIFLIHISFNSEIFSLRNIDNYKFNRFKYKIYQNSFVIGLFHKDGNGWFGGRSPKLIKNPDFFVDVMKNLNKKIPNLLIFLTGPSRGYIKNKLKINNIKFIHKYPLFNNALNEFYHCLDCYFIPSNLEGGPRAILECFATGVPIVSTKVGQAVDLIINKKNGYLIDLNDVEKAVKFIMMIYNKNNLNNIIKLAHQTSLLNNYNNQTELWKKILA